MIKPVVVLRGVDKVDPRQRQASMKALADVRVFVGVPEDKAARQSGEITNAALVYLHTHGVRAASMRADMAPALKKGVQYGKALSMYIYSHGSPLWHVPPRQIIEPAIAADAKNITAELKDAGASALNNDPRGMMLYFRRAGQEAENFVRGWFTNPANGWAPNAPSTIAAKGSDRPLINKGELRKSIVYVIGRAK